MRSSLRNFVYFASEKGIDTSMKINVMIDAMDDAFGTYTINWKNALIEYIPSGDLLDYLNSVGGSIVGIPEDVVFVGENKIIKALEDRDMEINLIYAICKTINGMPSIELRTYFLRRYYYSMSLRQVSLCTGFSNNKMQKIESRICAYLEINIFGKYEKREG